MIKEAEEGIPVYRSTVLCSIQGYRRDADLRNADMFKTPPPTERDWKALRTFVQANQDIDSYHILMAIRRKKPEMYASFSPDVRCRVLIRTLKFHLSGKCMLENSGWMIGLRMEGWKQPDEDWTKTATSPEHTMALIREGHLAVRYLAPLLKDKRCAPIRWRGKVYMWSLYTRDGGLRVCDYAYQFIRAILDRGRFLEPTQKERDKGIARLIRGLESDG